MTVKKTRRVAARPAKKTTAKAFAHWPQGSSAYFGVHGPVREALLVSAIVVAGYAKLNKSGMASTRKAGNPKVLTELVGPGPLSYHTRLKRFSDGKLTAEGAKWFAGRGVDNDLLKELIAAMSKGGKVGDLNFNREITA